MNLKFSACNLIVYIGFSITLVVVSIKLNAKYRNIIIFPEESLSKTIFFFQIRRIRGAESSSEDQKRWFGMN